MLYDTSLFLHDDIHIGKKKNCHFIIRLVLLWNFQFSVGGC